MKRALDKGFTLIELMIVVAIIGVATAMAFPAYRNYIENSNMAKVNPDVKHSRFARCQWVRSTQSGRA